MIGISKSPNDRNFHIFPLWPFLNKCRQVQKSASRLLLAGGTHSAVELTDHGAPLEAGLMIAVLGVCLVRLYECFT